MPIGEYTVTVESGGFSKSMLALTILSDRTTVLRVQLRIAPVSQQVEVRAAPGRVDSDSPTPVTLVNRRQIAQTPGASRTKSLALYQSKCATLDRQIDNLLYELDDLTPEEIAIVEESGQ